MQNTSHIYTSAINAACADLITISGTVRLRHVHERLHERAREAGEDNTWEHLAAACAYMLGDTQTSDACGPYTPMFELRDDDDGWTVYPPYLDKIEADVLESWRLCAGDEDLHPLVRARLADLPWVRRASQPPLWFDVAIDAYVATGNDNDFEIADRVKGLARAVAIAKATRRQQQIDGPLAAVERLAGEALQDPAGLGGIVTRALWVLAGNDHPCQPLIDAATRAYEDDPHGRVAVNAIAIRASHDPAEQERLRHDQISAYESEADRSQGLRRLHFLHKARSIAAAAGLRNDEQRLAVSIERTDTAGEGQTVELTTEIDGGMIDGWAAAVAGDDCLMNALLRFGSATPISDPGISPGQEPLLMSLGSRMVFGPDGGSTSVPSGDPRRAALAQGDADADAIGMFAATFGQAALDASHERHSPNEKALTDAFTCASVSPELARRIAVSYAHRATGDYISAVSVILPTLEPIARALCRHAGEPATTIRQGIPQVRMLGDLIRSLEPHIGPVRMRYLQAALTDPYSLNLRNSLAHGLCDTLTEEQYVTLFHIACLLRLTHEWI